MRPPADYGTPGGCQRHPRLGEEHCRACRDVWNEIQAAEARWREGLGPEGLAVLAAHEAGTLILG